MTNRFCRQLKASRIERGVSQVRLAREIGVSLCIISLWEHGNVLLSAVFFTDCLITCTTLSCEILYFV